MKKTVFITLCALFTLFIAFDIVMIVLNASAGGGVTVVPAAVTPRSVHPDFAVVSSGGLGENLALSAEISASSEVAGYPASKANDGDSQVSYWEGAAPFPQTLTLSFAAPTEIETIRLTLRASVEWGTRVQRFAVLADGTEIIPEADYTFDYASGNAVTLELPAAAVSELSLRFASNSGAGGGQISEFEVYGRKN